MGRTHARRIRHRTALGLAFALMIAGAASAADQGEPDLDRIVPAVRAPVLLGVEDLLGGLRHVVVAAIHVGQRELVHHGQHVTA